jgi:hypothetical protein
LNPNDDGVPPELRGRGYSVDSDEVLQYLFNEDGSSRYTKKRHLSVRESDDNDSDHDNDDDSLPSTRNTLQKRRNIRSDDMLKIVDGASLQSSALKSNGIKRVHRKADRRDNFTLREVGDPKKRELWKRCFEVIILDHIQRGPVEDILDSENGVIEPMVRDIQKRYYQMFGDDELLMEGELRAVISPISSDLY